MRNYFSDHHDPCLCHPAGLDHVGSGAGSAPARTTLRVLTLNARHGRGPRHRPAIRDVERFRENVRRIAAFLRSRPADVVALQEADGPSFWSGSEHHVERYQDEGGYGEAAHGVHFTLCRPRFGLSYGTALLSRLPLSFVESRRFRARPLDPKGFVLATVPFAGREVDVVSVHLDVFGPIRRRQVETLIRVLRPRHVALLATAIPVRLGPRLPRHRVPLAANDPRTGFRPPRAGGVTRVPVTRARRRSRGADRPMSGRGRDLAEEIEHRGRRKPPGP